MLTITKLRATNLLVEPENVSLWGIHLAKSAENYLILTLRNVLCLAMLNFLSLFSPFLLSKMLILIPIHLSLIMMLLSIMTLPTLNIMTLHLPNLPFHKLIILQIHLLSPHPIPYLPLFRLGPVTYSCALLHISPSRPANNLLLLLPPKPVTSYLLSRPKTTTRPTQTLLLFLRPLCLLNPAPLLGPRLWTLHLPLHNLPPPLLWAINFEQPMGRGLWKSIPFVLLKDYVNDYVQVDCPSSSTAHSSASSGSLSHSSSY